MEVVSNIEFIQNTHDCFTTMRNKIDMQSEEIIQYRRKIENLEQEKEKEKKIINMQSEEIIQQRRKIENLKYEKEKEKKIINNDKLEE